MLLLCGVLSTTLANTLPRFWGAFLDIPRGPTFRLDLMSFTEYDSYGNRYGVYEPEEQCERNCASPGFNLFSLSWPFFYKKNLYHETYYLLTPTLGLIDDYWTSKIQNDFFHPLIGMGTVPREPSKKGNVRGIRADYVYRNKEFPLLDWGYNYQMEWANFYYHQAVQFFVQSKNVGQFEYVQFQGDGALQVGYLLSGQGGIILDETPLEKFFPIYGSISASGSAIFPHLWDAKLSMGFTSATGVFKDVNAYPIGTLFQFINISVAGFTISTYNDAANGSDFGPSFGITMQYEWKFF